MKVSDKLGNDLIKGDTVIVTVSKNSHYLTVAEILDVIESTGKILIQYSGTIKTKTVDPGKTVKYSLPEVELRAADNSFVDSLGRVVSVLDNVAYEDKGNIEFGIIGSTETRTDATLQDGTKVKNEQVIIIGR